MAATIAGLSTLGVKFGYAVETVAGQTYRITAE